MEEKEVSPDYLKRVNDGYVLAEHMPELAAQLKNAVKDKEDGFAAGIEQFQREQKERLPSWMDKNRLSSFSKNDDLDKDIDEKELE